MDDYNGEHLLAPLCTAWLGKIDRAKQAKSAFRAVAEECMAFLCESHEFLWNKNSPFGMLKGTKSKAPAFQMTVNKAHELVSLFGPVLYNRNPVRTVTPRTPFQLPRELVVDPALEMQVQQLEQTAMAQPLLAQDPMFMGQYQQMQMVYQQQAMQYQQMLVQSQQQQAADATRGELLARYLNYTPNELDLAGNFQMAITESLIKGMGIVVTESYTPRGSERRLVGSFYRTVDDLLVDPDAENWDDAQWIALRCVEPVWQVERYNGLPAGSLRQAARMESAESQGDSKADWDEADRRNRGETNDLIVYWKIWSKMGIGGRLTGVLKDLQEPLEMFGDYCYLEVAEGVPYLLNLPSAKIDMAMDEELLAAVEWPIPFWRDDRWPVTPIWYYSKPRCLWPIAPLAPGLGELRFINWCMSFLANRVKTSCRDFIAHAKSAAEEIKEAIESGPDLTFIPVEASQGGITNVVDFLKQPQVNSDVWSVLSAVMEMFDKRVGLTELLYGLTTRQMRSAAEASVKAEGVSVRPDYMAGQVEKAATEAARREALAARWLLEPADVLDILGQQGAQAWQMLVMDADVEKVARELEVRVEAGSARRPNRERDMDNMNTILPTLIPAFQGYGQLTGNYQPFNALIAQWMKVIEKDPAGLMLPDVQMMPPQPPPGEGQDDGSQENPQGQAA